MSEVKYTAHKIIIVTFQLQLLLPQIFLSYLQTNATTSNIVGTYCIHLHKAKSLNQFQTLHNNSQQYATACDRMCKQMQHVTSNNVGRCCTVPPYADLHVLVMGLTVPVLILFHSVGNVELHTKPNFRWLYNGSLITSCKEM